MAETNNKNALETLSADLKALDKRLLPMSKDCAGKFTKDLLIVRNRLYAQLESLSWLQRRLVIKGQLPPMRGGRPRLTYCCACMRTSWPSAPKSLSSSAAALLPW
jgi:hypothetical protein